MLLLDILPALQTLRNVQACSWKVVLNMVLTLSHLLFIGINLPRGITYLTPVTSSPCLEDTCPTRESFRLVIYLFKIFVCVNSHVLLLLRDLCVIYRRFKILEAIRVFSLKSFGDALKETARVMYNAFFVLVLLM